VVIGPVDRQTDHFHAPALELALDLRHVAELSGADRGEILRVREQHRPGIADPAVEADPAFGGFGLEIRSHLTE
jgi:hypothetical protein